MWGSRSAKAVVGALSRIHPLYGRQRTSYAQMVVPYALRCRTFLMGCTQKCRRLWASVQPIQLFDSSGIGKDEGTRFHAGARGETTYTDNQYGAFFRYLQRAQTASRHLVLRGFCVERDGGNGEHWNRLYSWGPRSMMQATLKRIWVFLFGYDIFLSYRRAEAGSYVEALVKALEERGLVCFIDREETVGGVALAPALTTALRRSRMLVAVLTPSVPISEWIVKEIEAFLDKTNRLLPISVGGLLSSEAASEPLLRRLRELSWVDETLEAVAAGEPSASTVAEIVKSYRWRRVRSRARLMMLALLGAVMIGGWVAGQQFTEGRRLAQVAYQDVYRTASELRTLITFMNDAAVRFHLPNFPFRPTYADLKGADAVKKLTEMNLAEHFLFGPLVGYGPISPPGDRRRIVKILAQGAQKVRDELVEIRHRELPLVDEEVLTGITEVSEDSFLGALVDGEKALERYHRIEDSTRQPFYILGSPGLAQAKDYVSFVERVEVLSNRVNELRKQRD